MSMLKSVVHFLRNVNLWKTLHLNFHYFPFKVAVRFPVFIYNRSVLYKMGGEIKIEAPIKTGMVKFGKHSVGTQDRFFSRTIWEVFGTLIVKGTADIGRGTKINIGEYATLTLGDKFVVTGDTEIVCQEEISFGNDCLLSWDILIMDTDFHSVIDMQGACARKSSPIKVGDHVWIGCRNVILKGVSIANNNIIAANSTVTRSVKEENCIIGGSVAGVIKAGVNWQS